MFHPYITISAAQARESDDLRHAISPFSVFVSKDRSGASSRNREQKEHLEELQTGTSFEQCCDVIGL